jgi:hypothetical protein
MMHRLAIGESLNVRNVLTVEIDRGNRAPNPGAVLTGRVDTSAPRAMGLLAAQRR